MSFSPSTKREDDTAKSNFSQTDSGKEQKPFGHPGLIFVSVLCLPTLFLALTYLLARNIGHNAVGAAMVLIMANLIVPPVTMASMVIQAVFTICTSWRLRRDGALARRIVAAVNVIVVALLLFALERTSRQLGLQ
jgi:hypothetical protein